MLNKFDLVVFNDGDVILEVKFDNQNDTAWLSQKQMAELFGVTINNVGLH